MWDADGEDADGEDADGEDADGEDADGEECMEGTGKSWHFPLNLPVDLEFL